MRPWKLQGGHSVRYIGVHMREHSYRYEISPKQVLAFLEEKALHKDFALFHIKFDHKLAKLENKKQNKTKQKQTTKTKQTNKQTKNTTFPWK